MYDITIFNHINTQRMAYYAEKIDGFTYIYIYIYIYILCKCREISSYIERTHWDNVVKGQNCLSHVLPIVFVFVSFLEYFTGEYNAAI